MIEKRHKISFHDVVKFSKITKDPHPSHVDRDFPTRNRFKNNIIQGLYLSSLSVGLISAEFLDESFFIAKQNFSYKKPVFIDTEFIIRIELIFDQKKYNIKSYKIKIYDEHFTYCTGQVDTIKKML